MAWGADPNQAATACAVESAAVGQLFQTITSPAPNQGMPAATICVEDIAAIGVLMAQDIRRGHGLGALAGDGHGVGVELQRDQAVRRALVVDLGGKARLGLRPAS